ncbi:exodeoxyribonuclease VII small subunit [Bacillus sp. HMF5848]|uniref:exodeoxyribonuclease VII small subunit n=1 Tax=Bacillus sp. HMF5848 TaxID=2495421 RepID=UPI000F79060A|nr:exodeoxyribonuclease VII small subunit [Bacillus sp. HMF5848]RSK27792.1 exodeoxyribonuclease VII small subunit [Bacillus sp. HMF5848]
MSVSEEKQVTFEEAMVNLEQIVDRLEQGDVPLEEAIIFFKEGMKLSKICHEKLQAVEKEMDEILREDGSVDPLQVQEDQ